MKKRILITTLAIAMMFSGCGKSDPKPTPQAESSQNTSQVDTSTDTSNASEFYKQMYSSNSRPIALMIDNDDESARPQIGLEDAYIVYEIIIEGGSTRFMAVFKDNLPQKAGPVRSSRHYFLDYAMENDAMYAHAGWSPKAANDISALGINNLNGLVLEGSLYWRDNTYNSTWHNLYTSIEKLHAHGKNSLGYRSTTDQKPLITYFKNDTDIKGDATNSVSIPYSNHYKVNYKYNSETKLYERSINSKEHKSQTGKVLTAKNIIVYQVENFNLPDTENKGRQDLKNIGSGTGYYISNGMRQEIKWEKTDRKSKTKYTLVSDGSELNINPGNTFIQIAPKTHNITFK